MYSVPGAAKQAPALGTFAERAWLTHVGAHNTLHHSLYNGSTWSGWGGDHLHWEVPSHVAMAPQGDRLWRVATINQQIHTSINGGVNGGNWVSQGTVGRWRSTHAPALANNTGTLHFFARGLDGTLWAGHYNGTFKEAHQIPGAKIEDAPAAASFNNKLHVMYRRQGLRSAAAVPQAPGRSGRGHRGGCTGRAPSHATYYAMAPRLLERLAAPHVARRLRQPLLDAQPSRRRDSPSRM
ncbi:hypothetical protein [Streptomyces sp. NBC_01367]|uniref:hypothetical protein n=1 Tax=Streptomyces sp. NBC_01367 TaxID=2903841 RepID=UPI003243342A